MPDLLSNALSGVIAYQRSLATVAHNVANANTPGYSRQSVELGARQPQPSGREFLGSGVTVADVRRSYDAFVADQIRQTGSELERLRTLHQYAAMVDDILADPEGGITPALQSFFAAVQDLASDPDSVSTRAALLARGEELIDRFAVLDRRIGSQNAAVNNEIRARATEINALVASLAELNGMIVTAQGSRDKQVAADLLDRQDELLRRLGEKVAVTSLRQDDGTVDVFIGNGQLMVTNGAHYQLALIADPADGSRLNLAYLSEAGTIDITSALSGGALGGLLDFRREVLEPTLNGLGRVALGLAASFNEQHRRGMDQFGDLGADFFSQGGVGVIAHRDNTGGASVAAAVVDASALTTQDYRLSFDGAVYTLASLDGTSSVTGAGPGLALDGLSLSLGGFAAAGDSFLIRPTRDAAGALGLAIDDTARVAAAAPIRAAADLDNAGNAGVSDGSVLDAADPDLRSPVTIRFNDPPATYDLLDSLSGAVLAAGLGLGGGRVDFNGWRVQIAGTPAAGDRFFVADNAGGFSDNRNALALGTLVDARVLANGVATYQQAYSAVVGTVGTQTRQAEVNADAQQSLLEVARDRRESISGVNLDEEAADLVRLQQAYEASARVMQTANELFDSLLQML